MNRMLNLHLIQWQIIPGDIDRNLDKAERLVATAAPGEDDVILLPEMFSSGFDYQNLGEMADRFESVMRWMGDMATGYRAGVAGSVPTRKADGIANTMVFVDKAGKVSASYEKIHLFSVADENLHFIAGHKTVVAQHEGLGVGLAICFDLRFPEMIRNLCDKGAIMVLVSAQWPQARVDHFRDFTRVRAMENQIFVAACNSCGSDGKGLVLGGGSSVVGPSGEVKGVLGTEEGFLTVKIDLDEVKLVREKFPVLKVRRKDLFGE